MTLDQPEMVYRQRLDRALTALNNMLILVRVAKAAGVQFQAHHEQLFAEAEALVEDETDDEEIL